MKYLPIVLGVMLLAMSIPGVLALTPDGSTAITPGDFTASLIILLFIVTTMALFYTLFLTIAKLVTAEETIYDVLLAWGSFILLIIVNHLTAHYLEDVFIYNLTENFLSYISWPIVILPLIAFILSMVIKSFKKKNVLNVREVGGFR